MVFHTTKHNLWRSETIPLANLFFVNREITDKCPCNHLSDNTLRKTSKNAVFSTKRPFRDQYPPFFGAKIRIFIDKSQKAIQTLYKRITLGMPNIERMMPAASDKGKPMTRTDAVRHRTKVASHTVVPLGTANQRSLFAKRGKVNGWYEITP